MQLNAYCHFHGQPLWDRLPQILIFLGYFNTSIMELSHFNIDDDFFETGRTKEKRNTPISYNAKVCPPQWFLCSENLEVNVLKYKADFLYQMKDFREAITIYRQCLDITPQANGVLIRDISESLARCYAITGNSEEALIQASNMYHIARNDTELMNALLLLLFVYKTCNLLLGEIITLQNILLRQANSSIHWVELGQCFKRLCNGGSLEPYQYKKNCESEPVLYKCDCICEARRKEMAGICFFIANLLLHHFMPTQKTFAEITHWERAELVKDQMKQFSLSSKQITKCKELSDKWICGNKDSLSENMDKLHITSDTGIQEVFEERWFSWLADTDS